MKGKKGTIIAAVLLILVCVGAGALYLRFRPSANVGSKNITVTVIHADSTEKEFRYQTDAEYLGKVLEDEQLDVYKRQAAVKSKLYLACHACELL